MSEIRSNATGFDWWGTGNSRRFDFRSLRLIISPMYEPGLVTSLIVVPREGHPYTHHRIRQLPVEVTGKMSDPDAILGMALIALQGVTQTSP